MGEVVKLRRPSLAEQHKGKTLCRSGFHKWTIVKGNPFDNKQGRLVTHYRCSRCGASKTEAR